MQIEEVLSVTKSMDITEGWIISSEPALDSRKK